ncbi:unnamed protein product [Prunus armeniaca]
MGLPGFRFEAIPDGLPPFDKDATQDVPALSDSIRKNRLGPFKELLDKLGELSEVDPVTCIISDGWGLGAELRWNWAFQRFSFGLPLLVASWVTCSIVNS